MEQKTRVVNMYKEKFDVYIGRGRGSIWGNEFSWKEKTLAKYKVKDRKESIEKYKKWFYNRLKDLKFREATLKLKGKVLGCFCKPLDCHGDIIVNYLEKEQ